MRAPKRLALAACLIVAGWAAPRCAAGQSVAPSDLADGEIARRLAFIEHSLDVIKSADWIIDLGPEGGEGGGRVVAHGTPEQVAKAKGSVTGEFLTEVLKP